MQAEQPRDSQKIKVRKMYFIIKNGVGVEIPCQVFLSSYFGYLSLKKKKNQPTKQGAQCWLLSFYSSCQNLTVIFGRSSTHSHLYQCLCLGLDKCLWGRWEWWLDHMKFTIHSQLALWVYL